MVLFARPLLGLIHNYPMPTLYFFMRAVTGSVPLTLKQANIRRFSWKYPLYIGIGLSVVLLFVLLPSGALPTDTTNGAGHDKIPPAGISYNSRICTRFPDIPSGPEILFCILTFAAGFGIIRLVSVTEIKQLQKFRPEYQ